MIRSMKIIFLLKNTFHFSIDMKHFNCNDLRYTIFEQILFMKATLWLTTICMLYIIGKSSRKAICYVVQAFKNSFIFYYFCQICFNIPFIRNVIRIKNYWVFNSKEVAINIFLVRLIADSNPADTHRFRIHTE